MVTISSFAHILAQRELKLLYSCLMNVTVNTLILAFVKDTLIQFIFVQLGDRFQANTRLKHPVTDFKNTQTVSSVHWSAVEMGS